MVSNKEKMAMDIACNKLQVMDALKTELEFETPVVERRVLTQAMESFKPVLSGEESVLPLLLVGVSGTRFSSVGIDVV